jgi:hypothetical protein
MNKDKHFSKTELSHSTPKKFSGQAIIAQLLKLIPSDVVNDAAKTFNGDRYYKKFKTNQHLTVMLFGVITGCRSLRDKVNSIIMLGDKLMPLGIRFLPARSTVSDANALRNPAIFEAIYISLYQLYKPLLADSHQKLFGLISQESAQMAQAELTKAEKTVQLIDGTTISLFKEILKNSGRNRLDGKRKGGIKCTTMLSDSMPIPSFVCFSSGATNDKKMLSKLPLRKGDVAVLDKGYTNYKQWQEWTDNEVNFVTRFNDNAKLVRGEPIEFDKEQNPGVLSDEYINLSYMTDNKQFTIKTRCVVYYDSVQNKHYYFATNLDTNISPLTVAECYRKRWNIELLFKQLKQNFQLNHFYGDNENALKIQIWCALIANLLVTVVKMKAKSKMSFSVIVGIIRKHTGSYVNLVAFLMQPYQEWKRQADRNLEKRQLYLFSEMEGAP